MLVQLIVECTMDEERESLIKSLGKVKYMLPIINSFVIELPEESVKKLRGIKGVKAVHSNARITAQMKNARKTVKADIVHKMGYTGKGIGIAILDTGVSLVDDLTYPKNRILAFVDFVNEKKEAYDDNGHGTHVAGIAAGNGYRSKGNYMGIAPDANIIAIKILDEDGKGNSADVLAGLQWMLDNKERYNIRIANLSIGTTDIGEKDPLVKAVEKAWSEGIFMTIAAGNNGPSFGSVTSPGISKKVLTVGASDDNVRVFIRGDSVENFSGRGPTSECVKKPDIVAPGADIISCLTTTIDASINDKSNSTGSKYYAQLSGTSMSTPIVSGGIALLLQKYPTLQPDDIKYMLKKSAESLHYSQNQQGWGLIDLEKLINEEEKHVR